jgi:hypothetical protein
MRRFIDLRVVVYVRMRIKRGTKIPIIHLSSEVMTFTTLVANSLCSI